MRLSSFKFAPLFACALAATLGAESPQPTAAPTDERLILLGDRDRQPMPPPANEVDLRQAFAPIAREVRESVVSIVVGGEQVALGTIVTPDGFILTKASELNGPAVVRIRGKSYRADLIGVTVEHDLAMLKIDADNLAPIEFTEAKDPAVGRWLAAVGPAELPISVGIVSVDRRTILADVYMGVQLRDSLNPGARVQGVVPGGNASRAGMQVDDLIIAINDEPIVDQQSVTARLSKMKAGAKVKVRVQRGDDEVELAVTLAARGNGSERSQRQNSMGGKLSGRRAGFPSVIQHDMVNLQPSECGSPLITLDGKVAGINIARAGRTETYALPSSVVRELIGELKSGKHAPVSPVVAMKPATSPPVRTERAPATGPTSLP